MDHNIYQKLAERIGEEHLRKRLILQVSHASKFYGKGSFVSFHPENAEPLYIILKYILKIMGLYRRGLKNSLDYKIEKIQVSIENLPSPFNGFRILQLSDLHADAISDRGRKLCATLKGIKADLCVLTGDFRFQTQGVYERTIKYTDKIINAVDAPYGVWGILGNHDFIEFVPALEASGVKMLLNEAVPIHKNGAEIWLAGVDDGHIYGCHDIPKAISKLPAKAAKILLSHTPEVYKEAADRGIDYMLCGHTHGGQICLPGGIPIIKNASCPRRFCSGPWEYKDMKGYTSRATGVSGLPVRFFCPPEITVHEFKETA